MADGFFCDTCGTCVCVCVCDLWLSHLFVSLQLCVLCVHFGEGTSTVVGFFPVHLRPDGTSGAWCADFAALQFYSRNLHQGATPALPLCVCEPAFTLVSGLPS